MRSSDAPDTVLTDEGSLDLADLKARGCQDILIAVTDGLKGMSEALAAIDPATTLQTCIVHLIRHTLDVANWKERRPTRWTIFERGPWGQKFPTVVASWRRAWTHPSPFFAFPPDVRRVVYTTNALESVHAQLGKIIKTRGHFPNDEAATRLIWLALRNITKKWDRGANYWKAAMTQCAILYEDRFTKPAVRRSPRLTHEIPDTARPSHHHAASGGRCHSSVRLRSSVAPCELRFLRLPPSSSVASVASYHGRVMRRSIGSLGS